MISDRFTDATFAYQGGGRGLATARLEALEDWVQDGLQPDLTLLFDVPLDTASARLAGAREPDKFEAESRVSSNARAPNTCAAPRRHLSGSA